MLDIKNIQQCTSKLSTFWIVNGLFIGYTYDINDGILLENCIYSPNYKINDTNTIEYFPHGFSRFNITHNRIEVILNEKITQNENVLSSIIQKLNLLTNYEIITNKIKTSYVDVM